MAASSVPLISGVVVHWRAEEDLARLVAAWPPDPRFELVVVDNASSRALPQREDVHWLRPAENLGFAGGANLGARSARGGAILLLNPDVVPHEGALRALAEGLAARPDAAGLVPRLVGPDGDEQARWQLRPLPTVVDLLGHAFFLGGPTGPAMPPLAGAPIAQPAAAALLVRRSAWEQLGGLDERFHPAWFEDVDLACRADAAGMRFLYWPSAVFSHRLGGSVSELGYGPFLAAYFRNLARYLGVHHGPAARILLRLLLPLGLLLRLALLPLRKARHASSRAAAAAALWRVVGDALRGWPEP